jgi:hypothetical protein
MNSVTTSTGSPRRPRYGFNAARASSIMIHKSIMHQFVKFCILRFGQSKRFRIGPKISVDTPGDYSTQLMSKKVKNCTLKKNWFIMDLRTVIMRPARAALNP